MFKKAPIITFTLFHYIIFFLAVHKTLMCTLQINHNFMPSLKTLNIEQAIVISVKIRFCTSDSVSEKKIYVVRGI